MEMKRIKIRLLLPIIAVIVYGCPLIVLGQATPEPFVVVEGVVEKELKLTLTDIQKYPSVEVKGNDKDGKEHRFKGTLLHIILDSAGVTLNKRLRGENLAKYILIKAADGYKAVYSLPEIDPEFTTNTFLLATHMDGKPLPKGEGPFRMVAPQDKKHARWVREVTSIKIISSKE